MRRHPSAGNLNVRPMLVRDDNTVATLPPESFPHGVEGSRDRVQFGPDLDHDHLSKLLAASGSLDGAKVLDLGCGAGASAITLARKGARVTAVESSTVRLSQARHAAEIAEVKVEFHHSDLADLAFVRADSIDLVVAIYSLAGVQELDRVFRQLHRIMRPDAALVMSLPHPMSMMLEADSDDGASPFMTRTAWTGDALSWRVGGDEGVTHVHQIGDLFTTLVRANFRVDTLIEPAAAEGSGSLHYSELADWVPSTLIVRARKVGT